MSRFQRIEQIQFHKQFQTKGIDDIEHEPSRSTCVSFLLSQNILIATYLSFCDHYRPKYFILENVRNFVCFDRGLVLKTVLSCLVKMGYQVNTLRLSLMCSTRACYIHSTCSLELHDTQCQVGILQAGQYGIPQTRRRYERASFETFVDVTFVFYFHRTIIIGTAPGLQVPNFPKPTHVFENSGNNLNIVIDNHKVNL